MMETTKYILCGGEDLCRTYEGNGISERAKDLFNKWAIASLANPCLHEQEAFLDMPISSEARLLIRAIREHNKGSRTLTWYLGIELSKEEIRGASCYANLIRGALAISLESMKNLRGGGTLSVNLQYPSGLPQIQTPFDELKGKNFFGDYPRVLWEFCQKISLNDIEDWFNRLFLAVNVEVGRPEYTNMVCEIPPSSPPSSQPKSSPSTSTVQHSELSKKGQGVQWGMKKIFFFLWFVFTIGAVCWGVHQSAKLSDSAAILERKDQIHQDEIEKLNTSHKRTIEKKDQEISELKKTIATLSAPKDIAKTLSDLDAQIRDIEKRLDSINNAGKKISELKQSLRALRDECGHAAEAKAGAK